MALTMAEVARDYETDGVPSSGSHKIKKGDLRNWGAWVEGIINAFTANGGLIYSSKTALDADLAHAANTMAWVLGDATVANNGVYQKQGASGAGSWTRVADLPFSFIIASDAGAGTANAIQATTSIPVSSSALIWMNIFEANTASPVTVSFNGGSVLTIKTNSGNDVEVGGLTAGMIVMGIVSGSTFRLVSDQASAAVLAACVAAQTAAEEARDEAVAAASSVQSEQVSRANAIANYHPSVAPDFIRVAGYASAGDGGAALYKKVVAEPSHAAKLAITLTPSGTAWYEIAERKLRPEMLGAFGTAVDNQTALANLLAASAALSTPIELVGGKNYAYSGNLSTIADYVNIDGDFSCKLVSAATSGYLLSVGLGRTPYATKALTANVTFGTKVLTVADTTGIAAGDIVQILSNKAWYNDPRENAAVTAGAISFTSAAGSTTSAALDAGLTVPGGAAALIGQSITFTDGVNAGFARVITNYFDGTKTVTFAALPVAVASGVRYVIPEAVKGQTCRVGRVISATQIEVVDTIEDGYHVQDGTAANIKEAVTLKFFKKYSPRIRGFTLEGPAAVTTNVGLGVFHGTDIDIDVKTINCRSNGRHIVRNHRGIVRARPAEGSSRVETGYGAQISESALISIDGTGWNNRRLFDVSGNAPSDSNRVFNLHVDGGGLQADGSAYYPVGAVENFGVGSHGPARNTIYENCSFRGVQWGVYERGRGAIVRNCYFGPGVKIPVTTQFGGRFEVYDNVIDGRLFENVNTNTELNEASNFGSANARNSYADCVVLVGANLLNLDPNATIVVRDNIGRVKNHIVQFHTTSGSNRTLENVQSFDNNVELFPLLTTDETGQYGKFPGSAAGTVTISGGVHGPNRMRTAAANTQPVIFGAGMVLATTTGVVHEFGPGLFKVRLANDGVAVIPICQNFGDKLRVDIALEEESTNFFSGWINKNSATTRAIASAGFEALASAPPGEAGTDGLFQMHYAAGKLTVRNRLGFIRTPVITVHSLG